MRPNPEMLQDLREYPILYVDDEVENLRIFELTFRRHFGIYTATSGEEGLEILNSKPVAVVLSDHRMPGMTGTEFLARVAEIDPNTIRIMVTAYGDAATLQDAINNGAIYHFIPKPWNPDDVRATLTRGIHAYALDRERAQLLQELSVLNRVSVAINQEMDADRLLDLLTDTLRNDLGFDGASVLTWSPKTRSLSWAASRAARDEIDRRLASLRFTLDNASDFVSQLLDARSLTLTSEDLLEYSAAVREWVSEVAAEEILVTPLYAKSGLIGAITVDNRRGGRRFLPDDVTLIEGLASLASVALENARLVQDLRRSRDLLRQIDRLGTLGTLATSIAREIKAPLASIERFMSEAPAKRRADDGRFWGADYDATRRDVERLRELAATMHRLGQGRTPVSLEKVDVGEIASDVVILLRREAELGRVALRLEVASDTPKIVAVRDQVHQVTLTLVLNALTVTPPGGSVRLRVSSAGDGGAQLEVCDGGPVIPPERLERVFDPFASERDDDDGSGLGLMVCQRIVEDHGGTIELESAEEGTAFRVRLPADAAGSPPEGTPLS